MDRKRLFHHIRNSTILAVMAIGAAYVVFLYVTKPSPPPANNSTLISPNFQHLPTPPSEKTPIHLYFKDRDLSFLGAETRELACPDDPVLLGKAILDMLIKGPERGLAPTIPPNTGLRTFFIDDAGTAYADLTETIQTDHPGGSVTEMMTLYSIVNSLVLNVPGIKRVKILINGQESKTLAGHIDIRNPFKANMLMVR